MKIESYTVGMSSASSSTKSVAMGQRITISGAEPMQIMAPGLLGLQQGRHGRGADMLSLSPDALSQQPDRQNKPGWQDQPDQPDFTNRPDRNDAPAAVRASNRLSGNGIELADKDRLKLMLLERMIEALTGKKYKFSFGRSLSGQGAPQNPGLDFSRMMQISMPQNQGVRITAESYMEYRESQQMTFQATGLVNTSDGRRIQFDMNVLASYEFTASMTSSVEMRAALNFCDPLIINFDGALPEFTKDRYEFDLTIDGKLDNIFMPTNGSGFLALDKNGDGVINDGSELFGAKSGNGFADLAAYDEDGNGWIDDGDSVFGQLKLMFVDKESGEFMQVSLKDLGVGAIFLGSVASEFEIKGAGNEAVGQVRRSGIFLNENGSVGAVHHIDLTY